MIKVVLFLLMCLTSTISFAQNDNDFIKAESNVEYKIFPTAEGTVVNYGNFLQMHIVQMYRGSKDTILYDSKNFTSPIQPVDTSANGGLPIYYYNILKQLKKNDSVAMRVVVDSAFKNTGMPLPPNFESGKYIYTCIKIEEIYTSKADADTALERQQRVFNTTLAANNAKILYQQDEVLKNFFTSKKIANVIKAPQGTYIKIIKKGIGRNVNDNDKVKVNYTGKTYAGKMFDSNTDPKFGHVTPLDVDMTQRNSLIMGWLEGLTFLNKGAKAQFYIPSPLGFGSNGTGDGNIGPDEILIFDIELVDIEGVSNKPATTKAAANKKTTSTKTKPVVKKKK